MKGLLIKDLRVIMRQLKLFFVAMIIMLCIPHSNMFVFSIIYSAMMPFTIIANDERSKWDKYEAMLPIFPVASVLEKYIIGYGGVVIISVLAIILQSLAEMIVGGGQSLLALNVAVLAAIAFIMEAVYMPFVLKLGAEKGRLLFALCVAVVSVVGLFSLYKFPKSGIPTQLGTTGIVLLLFAAAIVINLISIAISVKISKGREA